MPLAAASPCPAGSYCPRRHRRLRPRTTRADLAPAAPSPASAAPTPHPTRRERPASDSPRGTTSGILNDSLEAGGSRRYVPRGTPGAR